MAFVSESLDRFLSEVKREEDLWADRQIDRWEQGEPDEPTGSQDPFDPAYDPKISSIKDVQEELAKLGNRKITMEEFNNLCSWVGDQAKELSPESLMTVFKNFIWKKDYIMDDLSSGGQTYLPGLEILASKLSQM